MSTEAREGLLNMYTSMVRTQANGICSASYSGPKCIQSLRPKTEVIKATWDNLDEVYFKYADYLPFYVLLFKDGRKIVFDNAIRGRRSVHEKCGEPLDIQIEIVWEKKEPTLKEIIEWPDGDTALRYLAGRFHQFQDEYAGDRSV